MENILELKKVTKKYPDFELDNISFELPKGAIMGLIGENGAGKSTIIKAILDIIKLDGGEVVVLGEKSSELSKSLKENIGVVFDSHSFHGMLTTIKLGNIFKATYQNWDEAKYFGYLEEMQLPRDKQIKKFSKGMQMKLAIAVALSHNSKLLILDEPTSGLDPVAREEILDLFLEFIQNEEHAILISSHITTDLEKVADYITFIHEGKLMFSRLKDELIYEYGILKCGKELFEKLDKNEIIRYRKQEYGYSVLVANRAQIERKYSDCIIDTATIDEIIVMYVKGERR